MADYWGVPDSGLVAIGKVTVAAGILEGAAQDIDHALGGAPGNKFFRPVIQEIRARLTTGLPPHARVTATEIEDWADKATSAMGARDRWAHSTYQKIFRDNAWEPIAQHIRSGERTEIDEAAEGHAKRLSKLAREGGEYLIGLRLEVRKGVFWGQPRHDDGPWTTIKYLEDEERWPERLSEAELDELWELWVSWQAPS